jgi:hypothetical protein
MRRCILLQVVLLGACSAAPSPAAAQEKAEVANDYFLRIGTPKDRERYAPGANCTVVGSLLVPKAAKEVETLGLRLRAYQPGRDGFVVAQEALVMLKEATNRTKVKVNATGHRLYSFQVELTLPQKPGEYLLRLDCLNIKQKEPDGLVESRSLFLQIPARVKAKEPSGERK